MRIGRRRALHTMTNSQGHLVIDYSRVIGDDVYSFTGWYINGRWTLDVWSRNRHKYVHQFE